MKTLFALLISLISLPAIGQVEKETMQETYRAAKVLQVANINGDVTVEVHSGSNIIVESKRTLTGTSAQDLEDAKSRYKIATISQTDTLIIYIAGVGECFCKNGTRNWRSSAGYGYHYNDWKEDIDFNFDFKILVPATTDLVISTVNNGDVDVSATKGSIRANNVNGDIKLKDIVGEVHAYTVNGDVAIDFDQTPPASSKFYTLNGDINANFKQHLNADLGFKSYNGDLFTNINELTQLPSKIEKSEHSDEGISYKIAEYTDIQVRNGGVRMDFETFNGDVFIKEI